MVALNTLFLCSTKRVFIDPAVNMTGNIGPYTLTGRTATQIEQILDEYLETAPYFLILELQLLDHWKSTVFSVSL